MEQDIYSSTLLGQHPRSFSCVPSTMSLLSWMGDVMTSAYNPHASCRVNGPAADLVEKKLIRWMCEKAGYPEGSGGLFVSGGSIANLTALTAARDAKLAWEDRGRAVVYLSGQTHASVSKGLHMIGFCRSRSGSSPWTRASAWIWPRCSPRSGRILRTGKSPLRSSPLRGQRIRGAWIL